jgi:hypothetical protein
VLTDYTDYQLSGTGQRVVTAGTAQFSGTLTLQDNGLEVGDQLTLFTYAAHSGEYENVVVDGTCLYSFSLDYQDYALVATIQTVTCSISAATSLRPLRPS